jgi:HAD superfamily hydrolase (TIGR01509 family)
MKRAVLWDLDGTLVDSGDYHWRAWRETLHAEGVELSYQQFLDSFGQRNDRILSNWLGPGTAADRIQRVGDAKEALYRKFARREGLVALPGALEWVRRLASAGWRQAIASSAPRKNVEVMLEVIGIDEQIEAIASAEDVTRGKPDPDVFLAAADRLDVPAESCVVVEDAAAGIEAARRAGMRSIGVNAQTLLHADIYATSLADLPEDSFDRLVPRRASST